MKTYLTIFATIFVVCFTRCTVAQDESLAMRYASLESKFLLLTETASSRNPEESAVARQILTESRRREIVSRLKMLSTALQEKRLSEATVLFKKVEDDLEAVERLIVGKTTDTNDKKTHSGKADSPHNGTNTSQRKTGKNSEREESAKTDRRRLAFQLLFRLKELHRIQSEIDEWIQKNQPRENSNQPVTAVGPEAAAASPPFSTETAKRMSELETTLAQGATLLADVAIRDKFDLFLTTLIKGISIDATELGKLLASGVRQNDWPKLSELILASLASAIHMLENSLDNETEEEQNEQPDATGQDDEPGEAPGDYVPSLDELIMIRQIQDRIARRIRLCEQWRKSHPEMSRELDRALHELAQEQKNLIEMLRVGQRH